MNEKFMRVYKKLDINDVRNHLMIYGDLSASCAKCKTLDIKFDTALCPSCQTEFKYLAFRSIKNHILKVQRMIEERPQIILVDYEDYSRLIGVLKAEEFLK